MYDVFHDADESNRQSIILTFSLTADVYSQGRNYFTVIHPRNENLPEYLYAE
jgi:hypothetical protein